MMKAYIENKGSTRKHLRQIKETAYQMREALLAEDFGQLIELLHQEWENRKQLAEGVTTPQIERLIEAATAQGAFASKICGAGGGGCLLTLCDLGNRTKVIEALEANGATVLPAEIVRYGMHIV